MSKLTFREGTSSRKVTRVLFIFQVSAMILAAGLSLMNYVFTALLVSCFALIVFTAGLLWLYSRYQKLSLVREKKMLEHFVRKFQKRALIDASVIQTAIEERQRLLEAEHEEIERALERAQTIHIEKGLADTLIQDADITWIDPALKEQMVGDRILRAAQITERINQLPGLGETERQALFAWQRSVREELHRTRPRQLGEKQLHYIQHKYQALQEQNGTVESRARASRELLQHEMATFRYRLRELERLTFVNFLGRSLFPTAWKPRTSRSNWS